MDKKKKFIIIIIILFIFLGLMIFTFANPGDEDETGNGDSKDKTEQKVDKDNKNDKDNKDDKDSDTNLDDETESQDTTSVSNVSKNNQSSGTSSQATDDSYERAKKAVELAEEKIDENSINEAQDLVDKVQDQSKKDELQDRLDTVKDELDVKGLVESLKNKTQNAQNKDELDGARDFRTNEEIVKRVTDLTNENLKDELNSTLEELAKLLDDTKAPKLNVEDGELYNEFVEVEAEDEEGNGAQVVIKDSEGNVVDSITEDGKYTITATDEAYNEITVTITVDTTAPELVVDTINEEGYSNTKDPQVHATDANPFKTTVKLNGEVVREDEALEQEDGTYSTWFGIGYLADGEYEVTSTDAAGNVTETIKFILDRIAPTYNLVEMKNIGQNGRKTPVNQEYAIVGDEVWACVRTDEKLISNPIVTINGVTAEFAQRVDNEAGSYYCGKVIMTEEMPEGPITFTIDGIEDLAGNKVKTLTESDILGSPITLDKTAPTYTMVEIKNLDQKTEGYAKVGDRIWVYVTVNEHLSQEPTFMINGVKAKIVQTEDGNDFNEDWYKYVGEVVMTEEMEEGEIQFTVSDYYDLAGNKGEVITNEDITKSLKSIIFDKTAPALVVDTINEEGYSNTKDPQVHATDANPFKTTVKLNGEVVREDEALEQEDGTYSTWFGIGYLADGEYEVTSTDAAGNVTETIKFILDRTAPTYTMVEIKNLDQKTEGYAKVGDRIWVYVTVNEHLSQEPTFMINGVKAKIVQTEDGNDFNEDWYKYVGEVVMTEEMEEGEIQFTVSDYYDLAGNEGEVITNEDITEPLKSIIFDKTAPVISLDKYNGGLTNDSTVNIDDANPFSYIIRKDGKDDVRFSKTNEKGIPFARFDVWQKDGNYTIIATDLAGNESELSFTLDTSVINVNGVSARVIGTNNTSENKLAKIGDRIQVVIDLQEKLNTMPSLSINGETIEFVPTAGTNETHFVYEANYIVKAGDNVVNNEAVSFEIINIDDGAGNGVSYNGKENTTTLSNTDFNEIKYDIVAPNVSVNGAKINDGETITFKMGTSIDSNDINKYVIFGRNINGSREGQKKETSDGSYYKDRFNMGWLKETVRTVTAMDEAGNSISFTVNQKTGENLLTDIKEGDTIVLPGESIDASSLLSLPNGVTIEGNSKSVISGNLTLSSNNITLDTVKVNGALTVSGTDVVLKNVNVNHTNLALAITAEAKNVTIDGGTYTTRDGNNEIQGAGAIKLFDAENVNITGVTTYGGIHLIHYKGNDVVLENNNIHLEYNDLTKDPIIGVIVTVDPDGEFAKNAQEIANRISSQNNFFIGNNQRVAIQKSSNEEWEDIVRVDKDGNLITEFAKANMTLETEALVDTNSMTSFAISTIPYIAQPYSVTKTGNIIKENKIVVTSEKDIEYNNFINTTGYNPVNVIWWAQFSCDASKCEGFTDRVSNNKVDKIVEARRGDSTITMEAPQAKEGYKFVGWEVSIVKYSGMNIQAFEAIYE